jgi:aspartate kinase
LASANVNIEAISTSEIRISVVIRASDTDKAVQGVHTAFGLDSDGEAVVYAGTGR